MTDATDAGSGDPVHLFIFIHKLALPSLLSIPDVPRLYQTYSSTIGEKK
jgi:hypothetical protein